jgi:colanic acid/amylovoran biosynthesis glycosyltransferase
MRRDAETQRVAVLTYHRVVEPAQAPPGLTSATPAAFARQMEWLARGGRVVALHTVLAARTGEAMLPPRAVLVTFDDAYADFATHAWPVMRRLGIPVVLFVPTAYPDGRVGFWWDRLYAAVGHRRREYRALRERVKALPHDEAMALVDEVAGVQDALPRVLGWEELRALAGEGVTLAAHTRTHPRLDRLPPDRLAEEIKGAREDLVRETGADAAAFAYPDGGVSPVAVDAVRAAGIEVAFAGGDRVADLLADESLAMPRMSVGRRTPTPVLRARIAAPRRRAPTASTGPAVAYVMSRFPKLTETFVLDEIVALQRRDVRVELYPLLHESAPLVHPQARPLDARAHYVPFVSPAVVGSQLHWLRHRPLAYLRALWDVAWGTRHSANFLIGGLAIFPKAAHAARLMQADGVVHVHCHFANHPAVAGLIIARLTGLPYSFTAHGSDLHVRRDMLPAKVAEAAFVAAVSEDNRRLIVAECGGRFAEKVHVVRAGVDAGTFAPRRNGRHPGSPLRVLCVGTLHEVKGQAHLVDACRLLIVHGTDVTCRLVGEGPDRTALARRIAAGGLSDRVELVGARTRPEVVAELAAADVLVAPSVPTRAGKREGIPVVLMEAMSSGVAVVASALSGIPELVEDGVSGLLVPPGDAAALAAALRRLHDDSGLRARLAAAGRARVLAGFDVERSAEELVRRFGLETVA